MFVKTKRRIVFAVVFSLLVLMTVTLTTIYVSNRAALDRESGEMLRTYAERFSPDGQPSPGGMPGPGTGDTFDPRGGRDVRPGRNEPEFRLSTFYAVAYSENGEVIAVESGNSDLHSEESLPGIASAILGTGRKSGRYGNMTYLVEKRGDFTLVAMLDQTINDSNQTRLFYQMLVIGGAATAVLFVISIFIARGIVRPLEDNDRAQKRFVSDAGHELKTPVAVISANSDLLRREVGDREWLDNIDYENERMSDLVGQLLALSKAESRVLPKETVDLSKLVLGEVLPFETLAYEKGKSIASDVLPGISVDGNPGQLRQLVSILLDNALSHGTGDEILIRLGREKHYAVLSAENEADEMSREQIGRLFERFYRADEARNGDGRHYGLGLSIAKAVAEAHGGKISAEYKNGRAAFTVRLPVRK